MNLSSNSKNSESEKNKMYDLENDDQYEPKPINWKKFFIIFAILSSVITGIVLIWLYAIKGKDFLDYRSTANSLYSDVAQNPNVDNVKNYSYINDELKNATINATIEIRKIYDTNQGFDYTTDGGKVYADYVYGSRKLETINVSKTDYVFGYVDTDLSKDIPKNNLNAFPKFMTNRLVIRIQDGKIAAIGFRYENVSISTASYRYLNGSNTVGMKGH